MIIIYADGGSYNNQSKDRDAYGSFLVEGEKDQHKFKYGNKTNNEAEYLAVIFALKNIEFLHVVHNGVVEFLPFFFF